MKEPDINAIVRTLKREVGRWDPTAVGQVAEDPRDPFRILVSCLLSLRTKDEVTAGASARLFRRADTPTRMLQLREGTIARLIYPVGNGPLALPNASLSSLFLSVIMIADERT